MKSPGGEKAILGLELGQIRRSVALGVSFAQDTS